MNTKEKYETVIGLEVHIQLSTKSKAYCGDLNLFGETPNSCVSAISLGYPGTLPKPNHEVIKHAIRLGLALNCNITKHNVYARKNYFYPDLPKGYQITQDKTPICTNGYVNIGDKTINLTRIHMEEDAGKSIHDLDPFNTLIDLNRAGVPLLEIVSEPEIKTGDEAFNYVMEVRKLVRYLDICDGNMEEGSLRCDANISVRLRGESKFGTKVEVKNMNSSRNVKNAIDFEIKRQIEVIENGGNIVHETRGFDAVKGITISQRHKEEANDYRYFPEPDLQPIEITEEYISKIKKTLPPLPKELVNLYQGKYKLSQYDSRLLIEDKQTALFFNEICALTVNYKLAANLMNGVIKSYLNENGLKIGQLEITAKSIASLIGLIESNQISNTVATSKIFPLLISSNKSPILIAKENNWIQESDNVVLKDLILKALEKYPEKIEEYKNGKKGLIGLFMGEVMKMSKGKADPKATNKLLRDILDQ